jgi:hypothetical protein
VKVYTVDQADSWNQYVKSFRNWDVYYLCEYAISLMLHGDGIPLLICYEDAASRMCYVVMKRDISDDARFQESIGKNEYFDLETPYGYGGPLVDGTFSVNSQQTFLDELLGYCRNENIVSQFVRFHPLLNNHEEFSAITENRYLHDTIFMDTSSDDLIFSNMDSKNRNMVRKANNAGIQIVEKTLGDYHAFLEMYRETMRQHDANEYYLFDENYFEFLKNAFRDHAMILYATLGDKEISGAVFLHAQDKLHYHLSGTHFEYRNLAPGNLLLYEAAHWANRHGISMLHLGGGLSENDSLFGFKKQFNKNGRRHFYIGRTIFDQTAYNLMLDIRVKVASDFDRNNDFLIQYRR